MKEKLSAWLKSHEKLWELIRYVVAGGLTTVLSILIDYACCYLLVSAQPGLLAREETGLIPWIKWFLQNVNLADSGQKALASIVSWVLSVLFAYWINRAMVFAPTGKSVWKGLAEFAGGRVVSYLVFELGLMELLKLCGISNVVNRLLVTLLVMVFNYLVSKFWVFKKE